MPDTLQLERIYQTRLKANPDDSLAFYPTSEIGPSLVVAGVRAPTHGANNGLNLAGAMMLLLQVGTDGLPAFELHFTLHDEAQEQMTVGNQLKVQNQVLLRYDSGGQQLIWPLRRMKKLDVNQPPPGWQEKAVLAIFETANLNQCDVQSLAEDPDPGGAPDFCAVLCQPPIRGFEGFCKLVGCTA